MRNFNCGVFAWKAGAVVDALFDLWAAEWDRHRAIDQPALSRALHRCRVTPRILPDVFNAQSLGSKAWVDGTIRHFNWLDKADLLDLMMRFGDGISRVRGAGLTSVTSGSP